MLDRHNPSELLALIEGELDSPAEARLRAALATDPGAQSLVDQMRQDRQSLRTLGEPELPVDFLARLEPLIARPMLMEPIDMTGAMQSDTAAMRRSHRRRTRRVRWSRVVALAAVLGLATATGLLAVRAWRGSAWSSEKSLAQEATEPLPAAPIMTLRPQWSPADGTIHHRQPMAGYTLAQMGMASGRGDAVEAGVDSPGRMMVAEFAVVVQSRDAGSTEQAVQRVAASIGDQTALVRNFSYREAQQLAEQWRLANGRDSRLNMVLSPPAMAAAPGSGLSMGLVTPGSARFAELAWCVREQLKAGAGAMPSAAALADEPVEPESGQLVGSPEFAPALESQLDFSSRGAAYTLSVPAADVPRFVRELTLGQGLPAVLRTLPPAAEPGFEPTGSGEWRPLEDWLTEGPRVRQAVASLSRTRENVMVLVPIIVMNESTR